MRRSPVLIVACLIVLLLGAGTAVLLRGDGDRSPQPAASATRTGSDVAGQMPQRSPEVAVRRFLSAEQAGDHQSSFHLLSSAGLKAYPDVEMWARRRIELPQITGFEIEEVDGPIVTVSASHEPGLDPFVGLRPAHDTQRWRTRQLQGGWLVDPEPTITLQLPAKSLAPPVARAWVNAVQACDQKRAEALQVDPELVGVTGAAGGVCGSNGALQVSAARSVKPGPATADLVAQYGDAALTWARSVEVRIGGIELAVVLAPIGETWRVVSVSSA